MNYHSTIKGSRIGGDSPPWEPLAEGQTLDSPSLTTALDGVNRERQRLDYLSPCETAPGIWDAIPDEDDERSEVEPNPAIATAYCSACKVLSQCEEVWLASVEQTPPLVRGTIAGIYVA